MPAPVIPHADDRDALAVERTRQVFRYLKDFSVRNAPIRRTLRDQLWSLALTELPLHPSVRLGRVADAPAAGAPGPAAAPNNDPEPEAEPLLRVQRPRTTAGPAAPRDHAAWVQGGLDDPSRRPTLRAEVVRPRRPDERRGADGVERTDPVVERLDDVPARRAALDGWLASWDAWAAAERPAREALRLFERLYELLGRIERESERVELVVGDGRLRRRAAEGAVDHPVLLQRVDLEFDAAGPEFRVVDADRAPELYADVLQGDDGVPGERLHAAQQELERAGFHPLGDRGTAGFLRRLAGLLGPGAHYVAEGEAAPAGATATVERAPVLFLRVRTAGYTAAFDRVLEDLERAPSLPTALSRVVGVEPAPATDGDGVSAGTDAAGDVAPWGEPPDVLLSKPANLEQVQIARALERHRAVLVQGPPGTGKSHTIANLVGHLVAQGRRVLVTSHTTKALRVLRGHVVEELRPLCVTLLDQDLEGRAQLEEAVRGIVERVTAADEAGLAREVERLTHTRGQLIAAVARLADELRVAREAEYVPVVVAGEAVQPVEAAREVERTRAEHDWLPGPVEPGAPLPLAPEDLESLYATNAEVSREEEREFTATLPPLAAVLEAEAFADAVAALDAREPATLTPFWAREPAQADRAELEALAAALDALAGELAELAPWQRTLVAAGRQGGDEATLWRTLAGQVREAAEAYGRSRELLLNYAVELPDDGSDPTLRTTFEEIRQHVAGGGGLGKLTLLLHGRWKAALAAVRVNGRPPSRAEEFGAVVVQVELNERRRVLAQRWARQAAPVGLPGFEAIPTPPEVTLAEYVGQFDGLLTWWDTRWRPVEEATRRLGFRWPAFREREVARAGPASPFERDAAIVAGPLAAAVHARLGVVNRLRALRDLAAQDDRLRRHDGEVAGALRAALTARDPAAWAEAREVLEALDAKASAWARRRALLVRLEAGARAWAAAVRDRAGVHGAARAPRGPAGVAAAWRWRQLLQELERRAALDERALARELEQRRGELRETTKVLIDRKAWLAQLRRTDLRARQALIGWSDTQKKIGKGTGKRVPELQAQARELLARAREAVPVWIIPLARVAESFDPRARKFDVVIVDEASQSDVTGLLAFYLGERVVVVGDHEQVSPSAIGERVEDARRLIGQHLTAVPNAHLYDGQTSIYDLARQAFGGTIALREHFRCVPDIIDFSNHLAYGGQMRPLRDPATAPAPHVAEYVVQGAAGAAGRDGKTNLGEARATAALIAAMVETPAYADATFGAVALVGEEQAQLVQQLALSLVGAVELQRRKFAAGTPAQFQGDERDVMLLTMVDAPVGRVLPLRETGAFKQRYNVAASRARNQLWLVHSLDPARDLQPNDLRRRLIEHVRDPGGMRRAVERVVARTESVFEAAVVERLVSAGYHVEPQVEVGRYRIDLVVSDDHGRVAVECDGDRYHPPEQIPEDLARQAVLERAGWRFVRLRGTRFFRDPDESMAWVFEELARFGVEPVGAEAGLADPTDPSAALRDTVVRRAWAIMRERGWLPAESGDRTNGQATPGDLVPAAHATALHASHAS